MTTLLLKLLGEGGDIVYYEWKLGRPIPGWLLGLVILALAAGTLFFYLRQPGLSWVKRLFWSALRTLLLALVVLLLLEPILVLEREVPVRRQVLVLCDASSSMALADARNRESERTEAALALGQVAFPQVERDAALFRALRLLQLLPADLAGDAAKALEELQRAEAALRELAPLGPPELAASLTALAERQRQLGVEAEGLTARGEALGALSTRQAELHAALEELAPRFRAPVALNALVKSDAPPSRWRLLQELLRHPQLQLLGKLRRENDVRVYAFGENLRPLGVEPAAADAKLRALEPADAATALGTALEELLLRYSGQPIAGIVLLSDGAANKGLDPLEAAARLGKQRVPLYPVGLGVGDTQDVKVLQLAVQEVTFVRDEVLARVQIESHGYGGRPTELALKLAGQEVARRPVLLNGAVQNEEIRFTPRQTGLFQLEATVVPFDDESIRENNTAQVFLKIIDEKIKVLYVEGSPRWEYRYLRQILLRDQRLDVKFILTEGDPDLPKNSDLYLPAFPTDPAAIHKLDLVILGDVKASKFDAVQLQALEELVRKRGGSLLMVAGPFYTPREYGGTPLEKLLPVQIVPGAVPMNIPASVKVRLTPEGERSTITRLEDDVALNRSLWTLVSPLYLVPRLDEPRRGATVLATVSTALGRVQGRDYPLVAWQRYGAGKTMFVGTDQLWRLRFKRGDRYHARFWSQAIQFLSLSRLLGENKRMRLETERKEYQLGERIPLFVSAYDESFEPLKTPEIQVQIQAGKNAPPRTLALQAVPDSPGMYQGYFAPTEEGHLTLSAQNVSPADTNVLDLNIFNRPLEMQQPALQEDLLRRMAELSRGRYFPIRDLPALPEWVTGDEQKARVRSERNVSFPAFLVILLCASLEWFLRRRNDLA